MITQICVILKKKKREKVISKQNKMDEIAESSLTGRRGRREKSQMPKKRIGKREQLKNLKQENNELKSLIGKMQQQIASIEAQNSLIEKEIVFFHKQIMDSMSIHPELKEKGMKLLNSNIYNEAIDVNAN